MQREGTLFRNLWSPTPGIQKGGTLPRLSPTLIYPLTPECCTMYNLQMREMLTILHRICKKIDFTRFLSLYSVVIANRIRWEIAGWFFRLHLKLDLNIIRTEMIWNFCIKMFMDLHRGGYRIFPGEEGPKIHKGGGGQNKELAREYFLHSSHQLLPHPSTLISYSF